jgi:uncharacterized protein YjiS (DUF1127 family)
VQQYHAPAQSAKHGRDPFRKRMTVMRKSRLAGLRAPPHIPRGCREVRHPGDRMTRPVATLVNEMSVFESNRSVPLGAVSAFRVTSFVERSIASLRAWYLARATTKALEELSDRELEDIGILRSDIPEIADQLAGR